MMKIKRFVFNPFQENTYLVESPQGKCLIVDPVAYDREEKDALLGDLRAVQSRQNAGLSTAFSKGFSPVQPLGGSVPNGYTQSFSPSNVATSLGIENPATPQNLLVDA